MDFHQYFFLQFFANYMEEIKPEASLQGNCQQLSQRECSRTKTSTQIKVLRRQRGILKHFTQIYHSRKKQNQTGQQSIHKISVQNSIKNSFGYKKSEKYADKMSIQNEIESMNRGTSLQQIFDQLVQHQNSKKSVKFATKAQFFRYNNAMRRSKKVNNKLFFQIDQIASCMNIFGGSNYA